MFFAGVGLASGEIWKKQRKFTLTTFRSLGLGKSTFEDIMITESHELNKELIRQEQKPFDPKILFPCASANVVCSFAFGRRYEYTDPDFLFLLNAIEKIEQLIRRTAGLALILPIFQYIPTKQKAQLRTNLKALRTFISKIVDNHKLKFDPDHPNDYIDIFMKEIQSSENEILTDGHLRGTVTGLFFAGSGTTSNTMRWAMYCMLKYPDVQMAVQRELDEVVGHERMPDMSDRASLPYTMATLLEIQRFGSTAQLGTMHVASCDTELCGYQIPKGSFLMSNLWAVHHNPETWTNPEEFNPLRFVSEDGKVKKPKEFIPFSIGKPRLVFLDRFLFCFLFFCSILTVHFSNKDQYE